jgi:hypothetical protein
MTGNQKNTSTDKGFLTLGIDPDAENTGAGSGGGGGTPPSGSAGPSAAAFSS